MSVINIPNRKYWAVFDIGDTTKPVAVALFLSQRKAKEFAKGWYDPTIIKEVYAQINVIA